MTESYQEKRERMQRALASLPEDLRGRVSLRNAEAVAALRPDAQQTLASALERGLVKISVALRMLAGDPQASLETLLPAASRRGVSDSTRLPVSGVSGASADNTALAALLRTCYPDMPEVAARALAEAPALDELRAVFHAQETLFSARQVHPDFVIVAFAGLLQNMQERLDGLIEQTPAYQQALRQSGLDWHF